MYMLVHKITVNSLARNRDMLFTHFISDNSITSFGLSTDTHCAPESLWEAANKQELINQGM